MTHNMIMEHFEMHTEDLVDLVTEMHHNGPKVLLDVPDKPFTTQKPFTIHDCALLDEMSGLTMFVDTGSQHPYHRGLKPTAVISRHVS